MRRLKMFFTAFLIGVLCWTPIMQPFAAYAQFVLADSPASGSSDNGADSQQGGDTLPDAGDSEVEGEQGLVPESESGAVEQPDAEDVGAESDHALQSGQEDATTPEVDEAADGVAIDNTANGFVENSWRYDNGVLRTDLESADRSLLSGDNRPEGATAWGIDVSNHQGAIDWAKVKAAGVDYAILRCGYGEGIMDDSFIRNVQGCKKYGIPFGVYLYCYAWDAQSAREEAEGTLSILSRAGVKPSDLAFPVYYDIENTVGNKNHPDYGKPAGVDGDNQYHVIRNNATFTAMAETYCNIIQNAGYEPGVYASLNWWRNYLNDSKFNSWDRWVAQYYSECTYEGSYSMWQYSSSGRVDGINGNVDVNWYFEGSAIGWREVNGEMFYYGPGGEPLTGQLKHRGKWYWLDPERGGAMATGFVEVPDPFYPSGSKTCYYGHDGAMRYGEQRVDGRWYHFDESRGAMSTGLTRLPAGKTVLYGEDGAMLYGLQYVPGRGECFFDPVTGAMALNKWVTIASNELGYYNSVGKKVAVRKYISPSDIQLIGPEGELLTGWHSFGGLTFYSDAKSGFLVLGEKSIDGKWYHFDDDGVMSTGFVKLADASLPGGYKWVWYDADGQMQYGERKINGAWYYLNETSGAVTYGWKHLPKDDKWVWYGPYMGDGKMRYGRHIIDGVSRYFDTVTGACDKLGYQNPLDMYQVSTRNVRPPVHSGASVFSYISPSRIGLNSTRQDCIDVFVKRAFDYLGTPYIWDYACAPGVGVDCAGLVLQSLYATGMDLAPMNAWDHFHTPGHDQYANYMWDHGKFRKYSFQQRQIGDLVCYPGHIAIYIGGDRIIEAFPRQGVRISSVYSSSNIKGVLRPFV